jgi:hypothetical protein
MRRNAMTTMWINPQNHFEIKFLAGAHGQTWQVDQEPKPPQPPTPPKVPVLLLDDLEL